MGRLPAARRLDVFGTPTEPAKALEECQKQIVEIYARHNKA